MAASSEPRADADRCVRRVRTNGKRGGPFAGWTWRDARRAMQFGKREGAYGVRFPNGVRYFFGTRTQQGAEPGQQPAGDRRPATPPLDPSRARPPPASTSPGQASSPPPGLLSKRKLKSVARLQEFQQRRRLLNCRLRKVALQVIKRLRFDRRWRVYREWHAAHGTSDSTRDGAEDSLRERMDVDGGTNRAAAGAEEGNPGPAFSARSSGIVGDKMDVEPAQAPGERGGEGPPPYGLNASAPEFVPGFSMVDFEAAWSAAANDPRFAKVLRQKQAAAYKRGQAAGERRAADVAAKAAKLVDRARRARPQVASWAVPRPSPEQSTAAHHLELSEQRSDTPT